MKVFPFIDLVICVGILIGTFGELPAVSVIAAATGAIYYGYKLYTQLRG